MELSFGHKLSVEQERQEVNGREDTVGTSSTHVFHQRREGNGHQRRRRFYPKIPVTHKTYPELLFKQLKIGFVTFYGTLCPLRRLS